MREEEVWVAQVLYVVLVGWVSVLPRTNAGEDEAEDDAERPDVCWVGIVYVNVFQLRRNTLYICK